MYLGLLLTLASAMKLKAFAPDAPDDLHLTIIHSSAKLGTLGPLLEQDLRNAAGPQDLLLASAISRDTFGPPGKRVNVIRFAPEPFLPLREIAEKILLDRGIPWSKDFAFAPHITIGKKLPPLPVSLLFNRRVWR